MNPYRLILGAASVIIIFIAMISVSLFASFEPTGTENSEEIRKCRRTYGQYLVDEGYTVDKVAVILGHSSSRTTEYNYARPRNDRVATEIIEKWSCD